MRWHQDKHVLPRCWSGRSFETPWAPDDSKASEVVELFSLGRLNGIRRPDILEKSAHALPTTQEPSASDMNSRTARTYVKLDVFVTQSLERVSLAMAKSDPSVNAFHLPEERQTSYPFNRCQHTEFGST